MENIYPNIILSVYKRGKFYIESQHLLEYENNNPIYSESKSLSYDTMKDIIHHVKDENYKELNFNGLIPKNILYCSQSSTINNHHFIWSINSTIKKLMFLKKLGITSKEHLIPNLIFSLKDRKLQVFAVKTMNIKTRTPLYTVPLPNIMSNNTICFGSARLDKNFTPTTINELIKSYEDLFFKSFFTEMNFKIKSKIDPIDFWNNQDLNKKFDNSILKNTSYTLNDLL